jgi:hypothetical protein
MALSDIDGPVSGRLRKLSIAISAPGCIGQPGLVKSGDYGKERRRVIAHLFGRMGQTVDR